MRQNYHSHHNARTIIPIESDHFVIESPPPRPPKNNYWSWTFGITTFPFFFWGCPFYLLIGKSFLPKSPIYTSMEWFKSVFTCNSVLVTLISILLLCPTLAINAYVVYIFGDLFYSLFITGVYKLSIFRDILDLIRYLPVVAPLNYVWFRGFKVNNLISKLNSICQMHDGVGCVTSFRIKLFVMLLATISVHILRYLVYEKFALEESKDWYNATQTIVEFSIDIFCTFLLPLYCTFCYAITFQLYVIKAFIYKLIRRRILPNISHLSVIKTLFTQAADTILAVNGFFSMYLSISLLIMIAGTITDAQSIWSVVGKIFSSGSSWKVLWDLVGSGENSEEEPPQSTPQEETLTPKDIRELNADIACILIIYAMIFFTIRQAIGTNDTARELNVWLNDFVTGGGGTDVTGILATLKALKEDDEVNNNFRRPIRQNDFDEMPLIWAESKMMESGMDDELLRKFRNLKAYIHVRMQLEKPSLLNISLVGILAPSMTGRLKNYKIVF